MTAQERAAVVQLFSAKIQSEGCVRLNQVSKLFLEEGIDRALYAATGPKRWLTESFPEFRIEGNNGREVILFAADGAPSQPARDPVQEAVLTQALTILSQELKQQGSLLLSSIPPLLEKQGIVYKQYTNGKKLVDWLDEAFPQLEISPDKLSISLRGAPPVPAPAVVAAAETAAEVRQMHAFTFMTWWSNNLKRLRQHGCFLDCDETQARNTIARQFSRAFLGEPGILLDASTDEQPRLAFDTGAVSAQGAPVYCVLCINPFNEDHTKQTWSLEGFCCPGEDGDDGLGQWLARRFSLSAPVQRTTLDHTALNRQLDALEERRDALLPQVQQLLAALETGTLPEEGISAQLAIYEQAWRACIQAAQLHISQPPETSWTFQQLRERFRRNAAAQQLQQAISAFDALTAGVEELYQQFHLAVSGTSTPAQDRAQIHQLYDVPQPGASLEPFFQLLSCYQALLAVMSAAVWSEDVDVQIDRVSEHFSEIQQRFASRFLIGSEESERQFLRQAEDIVRLLQDCALDADAPEEEQEEVPAEEWEPLDPAQLLAQAISGGEQWELYWARNLRDCLPDQPLARHLALGQMEQAEQLLQAQAADAVPAQRAALETQCASLSQLPTELTQWGAAQRLMAVVGNQCRWAERYLLLGLRLDGTRCAPALLELYRQQDCPQAFQTLWNHYAQTLTPTLADQIYYITLLSVQSPEQALDYARSHLYLCYEPRCLQTLYNLSLQCAPELAPLLQAQLEQNARREAPNALEQALIANDRARLDELLERPLALEEMGYSQGDLTRITQAAQDGSYNQESGNYPAGLRLYAFQRNKHALAEHYFWQGLSEDDWRQRCVHLLLLLAQECRWAECCALYEYGQEGLSADSSCRQAYLIALLHQDPEGALDYIKANLTECLILSHTSNATKALLAHLNQTGAPEIAPVCGDILRLSEYLNEPFLRSVLLMDRKLREYAAQPEVLTQLGLTPGQADAAAALYKTDRYPHGLDAVSAAERVFRFAGVYQGAAEAFARFALPEPSAAALLWDICTALEDEPEQMRLLEAYPHLRAAHEDAYLHFLFQREQYEAFLSTCPHTVSDPTLQIQRFIALLKTGQGEDVQLSHVLAAGAWSVETLPDSWNAQLCAALAQAGHFDQLEQLLFPQFRQRLSTDSPQRLNDLLTAQGALSADALLHIQADALEQSQVPVALYYYNHLHLGDLEALSQQYYQDTLQRCQHAAQQEQLAQIQQLKRLYDDLPAQLDEQLTLLTLRQLVESGAPAAAVAEEVRARIAASAPSPQMVGDLFQILQDSPLCYDPEVCASLAQLSRDAGMEEECLTFFHRLTPPDAPAQQEGFARFLCQLELPALQADTMPEAQVEAANARCLQLARTTHDGSAILCLFYLQRKLGHPDQAEYALRLLADQPAEGLGDGLYALVAQALQTHWSDSLPSLLELFRTLLSHAGLEDIRAYCTFCSGFTTAQPSELIQVQLQNSQNENRLLSEAESNAALKRLFTDLDNPESWTLCTSLPLQNDPVGYAKLLYLASEHDSRLWQQCAQYCQKYQQTDLLLSALIRWAQTVTWTEASTCRKFLEEQLEEDDTFFRPWFGSPALTELTEAHCRQLEQTSGEIFTVLRAVSFIAICTRSPQALNVLLKRAGGLLFGRYCNLGVVVLCRLLLDGRTEEAHALVQTLSQVVANMRYRVLVDELTALSQPELADWVGQEENAILLRLILPDGNQPKLEQINRITYNGILHGHAMETAHVLSHLLTLFPDDYGIHNALFALCTTGFEGSVPLLHQSLTGLVRLMPDVSSLPFYRRSRSQNAVLLAGLNAVLIAQRQTEIVTSGYDFNVDAGEYFRRCSNAALSYSEISAVSAAQAQATTTLTNHQGEELNRLCQSYLGCITGNWLPLLSDAWKEQRDITAELNIRLEGAEELGFTRSVLRLLLPMTPEQRQACLDWLTPMIYSRRQLRFFTDFSQQGLFETLEQQDEFLPLHQLLVYPFEEYALFSMCKKELLTPAVQNNSKHLYPLALLIGSLAHHSGVMVDLNKEADFAFKAGLDECAFQLYHALHQINRTFALVHEDLRPSRRNDPPNPNAKRQYESRVRALYKTHYLITGLFSGDETVMQMVAAPDFPVWRCINLVMVLATSPRADEILRLTQYLSPENARLVETVLTSLNPEVPDQEKCALAESFSSDVTRLYLYFVLKHPYQPSPNGSISWYLHDLNTAAALNKQYLEVSARLREANNPCVKGFRLAHTLLMAHPGAVNSRTLQQKDPAAWWIQPQQPDLHLAQEPPELPAFVRELTALPDVAELSSLQAEHDALPNLRDNFQRKLTLSQQMYRIALGQKLPQPQLYDLLLQYGIDYYYVLFTSDSPEDSAQARQVIKELTRLPNTGAAGRGRTALEEAVRGTALFELLRSYPCVRDMVEDYTKNRKSFRHMRDMLTDTVLINCVGQIYQVLDSLSPSYAVAAQSNTAMLREALSLAYRSLEQIGTNGWMELKNRLQMLINEEINALDQKPMLLIQVLNEGTQPEFGFLCGQVQNIGQDAAESITLQANYGDNSRSRQYLLARLEPGAKAVFEVDYTTAPGTQALSYHLTAAYSHGGKVFTAPASTGELVIADLPEPDFPTKLYDTQNPISFSVHPETGEVFSPDFFGRTKETAELRALVQGSDFSNYRSAIVYGVRRTGKTSLLNYLDMYIHAHCAQAVSFKIDCQSLPAACIQYVFIDRVLAEVARALPAIADSEGWIQLTQNWKLPQGCLDRDPYNLDLFYRDLRTVMGDKGLIVIIDEVDRLFQRIEDTQDTHSSSLDNGLFGALSTILCSDACRSAVHFILCGSNWLIRYGTKGDQLQQMFQRFGDNKIEVGKLPERDARELLLTPYQPYPQVKFTPEALDWIWNYTGGLVWFTKLLGQQAVVRAKQQRRSIIYPSDVQKVLLSILNQQNCRQFYEGCGEEERLVINAMQSIAARQDAYVHVNGICALLEWNTAAAEQALRTLKELKIIQQHPVDQQAYRFELDIYRRYFRTESSQFPRVPEQQQVFLVKDEGPVLSAPEPAAQPEAPSVQPQSAQAPSVQPQSTQTPSIPAQSTQLSELDDSPFDGDDWW